MVESKALLTRNSIIKYWELSIGMCQSSSANDKSDVSDGIYEGLSGVPEFTAFRGTVFGGRRGTGIVPDIEVGVCRFSVDRR